MADRDPQIEIDRASPAPVPAQMAAPAPTAPEKPKRKWGKLVAMVSVPVLLVGGAAWYFYANANTVSTDNAYVQQDKVSISAELTGRVVAVGDRKSGV